MNHPLVGLESPDFVVVLERGKIVEFARATLAHDPCYLDDPRPVVPPTFLFVMTTAWGCTLERPGGSALAAAGLAGAHTLHGSYEVRFHGRLPHAGDRLTGRTRIVDVALKHGRRGGAMTFWRVTTTYRDGTGSIVAEETTVSIDAKDRRSGVAEAEAPPRNPVDPSVESSAMVIDRARFSDPRDVAPGAQVFSITLPPLRLTDIVRYQGAALDFEPMHHDDEVARRQGFPRAISVGMLHAGVLGGLCGRSLGPDRIQHFSARFLGLNWPGDALTYMGHRAGDGDDRVLHASCVRPDGETTVEVTCGR